MTHVQHNNMRFVYSGRGMRIVIIPPENVTMSPDVYTYLSMSSGPSGVAECGERPSARHVCIYTTNLLPVVFYVFRFYVRSDGAVVVVVEAYNIKSRGLF